MKIIRQPKSTIEKFEKEIGVELIIRERNRVDSPNLPRFYCSFEHVEVIEDGILCSSSGNGETVNEAIKDYARIISGKRIAINACSSDRREYDVPILI